MTALLSHLDRPVVSRRSAVGAFVALLAVAVVHLIDGPGSLAEQPYVGVLELALVAAIVPLALLLIVQPTREAWGIVGALNLAALAVFVASRTWGLPGASDDIGSWSETLGLVDIAAEAAVVALAARALARRPL